MMNWKKLGALAALALPMSILGAACTAEVADPQEATDTSTSTEESTAEGESITATPPNASELQYGDIGRYPPRGFCERRCFIEYQQCVRGFGYDYDHNGYDHDGYDHNGYDHGGFGRRRGCDYRYSRCLSFCYYEPRPY